MRAKLETHHTDPITVDELKDEQQITQSYLSSLFHEHADITLSQCSAEKRSEHACRLLRETDMLVKRTTAESGYSQKQSMIRAFKRHMGVTRGGYRVEHRPTTAG